MRQYKCLIKEFRDVTPKMGEDIFKFRMIIETLPVEKINRQDEKKYRITYEVIISCHEIIKVCWQARGQIISDNDFVKVLCIEGLEYFKKEFEKGNLSESSTVNLNKKYENQNGVLDCPYDLNKIQCYQNFTFQVEVDRKIGFR
jgi:hypothetical protein